MIDANLELLAVAETWDNGKAIREPLNADLPLASDHFRYFAAAIRAQDGDHAELSEDMLSYQFHEPLGVVGQIIPWNFPILMAVWKLAPALAAGTMGAIPVFWNLPGRYMSGTALVAGLAVINSVANLAGYFAPQVLGAMKASTGSYTGGLYLIAAVEFVAVALVLLFIKKQRIVRDAVASEKSVVR